MGKSVRIHIVEDELIIAMDLQRILQEKGYTIIKIDISGEQAINTAINCKPDVVLMDINLKGKLNGLQAAQIIVTYNIPIIFVTSQKDDQTTVEMEKFSPHYIFKPYQGNLIDDKIRQIISSESYINQQQI